MIEYEVLRMDDADGFVISGNFNPDSIAVCIPDSDEDKGML